MRLLVGRSQGGKVRSYWYAIFEEVDDLYRAVASRGSIAVRRPRFLGIGVMGGVMICQYS